MVAKIKPMMSLVSKSVNRSPTLDSGVSNSPGNCGMQSQSADRSGIGKTIARDVKDLNGNTASSSQVWHQSENSQRSKGTLLHKEDPPCMTAIKLSKAKVHVYSDSVLGIVEMHAYLAAMAEWKEQIQWFSGSNSIVKNYLESTKCHMSSSGLFFPGHTTMNLLREIQMGLTTRGIEP